jgi:hypothetical protein
MKDFVAIAANPLMVASGAIFAALLLGFFPGAINRALAMVYPRDDPRRAEMIAELYAVPRLQRWMWVAEQAERVLLAVLPERIRDGITVPVRIKGKNTMSRSIETHRVMGRDILPGQFVSCYSEEKGGFVIRVKRVRSIKPITANHPLFPWMTKSRVVITGRVVHVSQSGFSPFTLRINSLRKNRLVSVVIAGGVDVANSIDTLTRN